MRLVRMCCYANLAFKPVKNSNNKQKIIPIKIGIGNTGTEALAAHLAQQINPTYKTHIEEQLERLLLQPQLQEKNLDFSSRFR